MTTDDTISMQQGRVSVMTSTTAISQALYDDRSSRIQVGMPSNCSEPTVHRGNAARTAQNSVSETTTRRARRVVDSVATLSG